MKSKINDLKLFGADSIASKFIAGISIF